MNKPNKTTTLARDTQVIVGIQKHLQSTASLPLVGSTYAPADLVKLIQSRIDATGQADTTKATWHSTVATNEALNAKLMPVLRALRQYVINVYGATSPVLADFGFAPPKAATRTPEEKAAAVAKALATREARHTMGKVQKKTVKGNVTGIVVTPTTSTPNNVATSTSNASPLAVAVSSATAPGAGAAAAPRTA
ncbi:MAG: hypothetical protein ABTD50_02645 [Polyangiaceae bacterium]|jgi:hypothetical protein